MPVKTKVDPDVIVLGGGMSNIARLYENVPELRGRCVFSDAVETKLLPARHGDSNGVPGAAWLLWGLIFLDRSASRYHNEMIQ